MTFKETMTLDEVIEKLQEARKNIGKDVPVYLDINLGVNSIDDYNAYKCVDILYDKHDVRLYNF